MFADRFARVYAGTYMGIVEKLPYLKRLGVNAIELLPVHEFNELEYYAVRRTMPVHHPQPMVAVSHDEGPK